MLVNLAPVCRVRRDSARRRTGLDLGLRRVDGRPIGVQLGRERVEVRGEIACAAGIGVVAPGSADGVVLLVDREAPDAVLCESAPPACRRTQQVDAERDTAQSAAGCDISFARAADALIAMRGSARRAMVAGRAGAGRQRQSRGQCAQKARKLAKAVRSAASESRRCQTTADRSDTQQRRTTSRCTAFTCEAAGHDSSDPALRLSAVQ